MDFSSQLLKYSGRIESDYSKKPLFGIWRIKWNQYPQLDFCLFVCSSQFGWNYFLVCLPVFDLCLFVFGQCPKENIYFSGGLPLHKRLSFWGDGWFQVGFLYLTKTTCFQKGCWDLRVSLHSFWQGSGGCRWWWCQGGQGGQRAQRVSEHLTIRASILPPWCVLYSASGSGHSFCKLLMFKGIKDDVRIIRYDGAELYPD